MIKELLRKRRQRDYFDPSVVDYVSRKDLIKVFRGEVSSSVERNSRYFIICPNGMDFPLGSLEVDDIIDWDLHGEGADVFNRMEWFGKFATETQSQIIVPGKYELLVNPFKDDSKRKQVYLKPTERARYYGSGNLQLDKDVFTKVLRTDIGFEGLKNIVNETCSNYEYAHTLRAWR